MSSRLSIFLPNWSENLQLVGMVGLEGEAKGGAQEWYDGLSLV